MRGAGFGGTSIQLREQFPSLEQPSLRLRQPILGRPLRGVELRDGSTRFFLTPVQRLALVLRLAALTRELLRLLCEPAFLVGCVLYLGFVCDDCFLLFVVLGLQRRDGVHRLRNRGIQSTRLGCQLFERRAIGLDALTQFLDFPFGFEDAAGLGVSSARYEVWTAKYIAGRRRDGTRGHDARFGRAHVRRRNPAFANRVSDRVGVRTVDANDIRESPKLEPSCGGELVRCGGQSNGGKVLRVNRRRTPHGGRCRRNQESASSGAGFADQVETCSGVLGPLHDDMTFPVP